MIEELEELRRQIIELKAENEQLKSGWQESREWFYKIFHAAANPMAITRIRDGLILDANESFLDFSGFHRDELVGRTTSECGLWADAKQRETAIQILKTSGKVSSLEILMRSKSGEVFTALFSGDTITANAELCMLSMAINITERKRAEQKIGASKDHLDAILNHISDTIFVLDRQHRILLVNNAGCAFAGMCREDLIGTTTHQYLSKEHAEEMWQQEEDVFNTGKECITEDYIPDAKGNMHALIVKKSLLIDSYGNKELIGVARDVTEYKNLQAQMLQVQKMEAMGVLANNIAADFNNLLSIIRGYVDLALEERSADTELNRDLQNVIHACRKGESLTAQLMAFSQTHKLSFEIINLNEIIQQMSLLIRRLIGEAIEYESILDPHLSFINSDPDQVRQIITNLVVNAQAAMPEGGKLVIETSNIELNETHAYKHPEARSGFYVLLAISDNGIGMEDSIKAHLFEPFFTTKGEGKGTGLGLSTVYGIVKQSKGFIDVESAPGKGTKFLMHFPCER